MDIEWSQAALGFGPAVLVVLVGYIACWAFQVCWNHAVVPIWQLPRITKLQAFALLILVSLTGSAWQGLAQYKRQEIVTRAVPPAGDR
ncbi:hypothetical protein H5407_05390 [Mitsuaria sp. WAJ17]|uniref:hypothetical protein n=1 Tax=Mitsuaria sp. WAJ17 TaxID=2761452 RepID=UPI001601C0AA|nr:hypothetical protein [Mitsuaria sp. WAJ17]MBB2484656.1 hypothetical protein [Mitsuaria sp. WAJ17]